MRTHIRICMYIYTCMYICTYTYTHTYLGGVAKDAEAERQEKQRIELQESLRQQVSELNPMPKTHMHNLYFYISI